MARAKRYHLSVSGDQGALWDREVADTSLAYPADVAPLARDTDFSWEVQALGDEGALNKETSGFHVKSAREADDVRQHLEDLVGAGGTGAHGRDFLAGAYLVQQGLLLEAAKHFETLAQLHPMEPAPHEALGRIYRAIGLTDRAAAELQQALALTRKP